MVKYMLLFVVILIFGGMGLSASLLGHDCVPGNMPYSTIDVRAISFGEFTIVFSRYGITPRCFGENMMAVRKDEHGFTEFRIENDRGSARLFLKLLNNGVLVIDYNRIWVCLPAQC